jgi:hypothetical protein
MPLMPAIGNKPGKHVASVPNVTLARPLLGCLAWKLQIKPYASHGLFSFVQLAHQRAIIHPGTEPATGP